VPIGAIHHTARSRDGAKKVKAFVGSPDHIRCRLLTLLSQSGIIRTLLTTPTSNAALGMQLAFIFRRRAATVAVGWEVI
jgi:hypothetical protein